MSGPLPATPGKAWALVSSIMPGKKKPSGTVLVARPSGRVWRIEVMVSPNRGAHPLGWMHITSRMALRPGSANTAKVRWVGT